MTSAGFTTNVVYAATRKKVPNPVSTSAPGTEIKTQFALLSLNN